MTTLRADAQGRPRTCPTAVEMRGAQGTTDMGASTSVPTVNTDSLAPAARITVDSAHDMIRIIAGPYRIKGESSHHAHDASMGATVLRAEWPVEGWLRGYQIVLCDADASGNEPLPRAMVHHAGLANFSRRQLVYPMIERLLAVGSETDNVMLPSGVGVPLHRGDSLGVYAGLHGLSDTVIAHAYVIVTLPWARMQRHRPIEVLPFYADVNNQIGGTTAFDVPPGTSVRSAEFTMPIGGRLLGIGGHMHDYGVALRLEDAESGKVFARLRAQRTGDGHIRGVSRFNFGFHEDGLRLEAGHRYRIVAEYDNPTGKMLSHGGMGSIAGAFAPDDLSRWPRLDRADADVQRDEASLAMGDMAMP
ncbi:MAG: hypothetical protein H0U66_02325 [Gemmatimonadaceae bacterium]|nr:hypothetical protein [Gemmatimonadaceae bacterium]